MIRIAIHQHDAHNVDKVFVFAYTNSANRSVYIYTIRFINLYRCFERSMGVLFKLFSQNNKTLGIRIDIYFPKLN